MLGFIGWVQEVRGRYRVRGRIKKSAPKLVPSHWRYNTDDFLNIGKTKAALAKIRNIVSHSNSKNNTSQKLQDMFEEYKHFDKAYILTC